MLILFLMWQVGDAFNNWNAKKELRSIASSPESDHMFKVDSFEALDKISNALEKSIIAIEGMGTFRFVSTCNYSYNQRKKQLYLMSHYGLLL